MLSICRWIDFISQKESSNFSFMNRGIELFSISISVTKHNLNQIYPTQTEEGRKKVKD